MASELAARIAGKIEDDLWLRETVERGSIAAIIDAELADVRTGEGWRPIAEAPKDGWFWIKSEVFGPRYGRRSRDPRYAWEFFCPEHADEIPTNRLGPGYLINAVHAEDVTHFMPLLAPPVDRAATEVKRG